MLKDINDLSDLIAGCFNIPNIYIEKYSWVHTVYLRDEEGVGIGEIIVSRCDQSGLTYDISIPDYDCRKLLLRVNIDADSEKAIKTVFKDQWNREIQWKMNQTKLKYKNLGSMMVILEREINK